MCHPRILLYAAVCAWVSLAGSLYFPATMLRVITEWRSLYGGAKVCGHRDFAGVVKACPSFDAIAEYRHL